MMQQGMACTALAAICALPVWAADAARITVPSGQEVTFLETIWGEPGVEGLTARFRFVAPAIARDGGTVSPELARDDMVFLCENFALPRLSATGPKPAQIVISLADRPLDFGQSAPEATQFFEAFRPENGACALEEF